MSVGDVAGLIAAVAFVFLVGVMAIPLVKLGGVFDETRSMIKGVSDETVPLLSEVTTTVTTTNAQLVRVDAITSNVQAVTTNVRRAIGSIITSSLIISRADPEPPRSGSAPLPAPNQAESTGAPTGLPV